VFLHKVFAWQRRRARTHGIADPHCGAVTFVQRFGSLLNLNCHAHALLPDGVFAADPDGAVRFHPLPPPWDDDVARLLDQIARAIHRLVERHRASRSDDSPPDLLASEQARAIADSPSRGRAPFPKPTGRRSAFLDGYSLHADRLVDTDDRDGLERLARYGARSPVANSRLSLDPSDRVVLSLNRPLHDGRTALAFTPLDFLRRIATLIPPPRAHLTRYPRRVRAQPSSSRRHRSGRRDRRRRPIPPGLTPSTRLGLPAEARVRHRRSGLQHLRRRDAHPRHPPRGRRQPLHSRAPWPTHRAAASPRGRSARAGV